MPPEIASGLASYLTPAQFLERKDIRPAAKLVKDDGSASLDVANDPILMTFLRQASGMIESAAVAGAKYTVEHIQALVDANSNAGNMIQGFIADIVAHQLCERRWASSQETLEGYQTAMKFLEKLRSGELVLPVQDVVTASVVASRNMTQQQLDNLHLVSRETRYFGFRNSFRSGTPGNSGW